MSLTLALLDTAINVTIDLITNAGTTAILLDFLPIATLGISKGVKPIISTVSKALGRFGIAIKTTSKTIELVSKNTTNLVSKESLYFSKTLNASVGIGQKLKNPKVIAQLDYKKLVGSNYKNLLNRNLTYNNMKNLITNFSKNSTQEIVNKNLLALNKAFKTAFKSEKAVLQALETARRTTFEKNELARVGLKLENFSKLSTLAQFRTGQILNYTNGRRNPRRS